MAQFNTYDPSLVIITFCGVNITGIMDGTFVEVERDEDSFMKHVGASGDVTRTRNLNRSGKVTITLTQSSPSNDLLAALLASNEAGLDQIGPFQLKDAFGTMRVNATYSWISKQPKIERSKDYGSVQWVIECADLDMTAGRS